MGERTRRRRRRLEEPRNAFQEREKWVKPSFLF